MNSIGNGGSTPKQYWLPNVNNIKEVAKYLVLKEKQQRILELVFFEGSEVVDFDKLTSSKVVSHVIDIIELGDMNFSRGNIFKAICRLGTKNTDNYEYNKVLFFASREVDNIIEEMKKEYKEKPNLNTIYLDYIKGKYFSYIEIIDLANKLKGRK